MEWQDEGIILHTQSLGETKAVVSLFTQNHGRCGGILTVSRKNKGWIQAGEKVKARWGARLETHLGYWTLEPLQANVAFLLDAPGPLAALSSATSLCQSVLPERHSYPHLYQKFQEILRDLSSSHWIRSYVFFEMILLEELGYGLNLNSCAVTGDRTNLVAVSPRTGRAVSAAVAQPYQSKLLPLPLFLCQNLGDYSPNDQEILDALHLTGYFLERYLLGRSLPAARERLYQRFVKVRKCA